jgi:hypothetical protein
MKKMTTLSHSDPVTEYIALSYRTDKHGHVRKTKLGRAFSGRKEGTINISFEASPLPNQDGECWVSLVPYDPNFGEQFE